MGGDLRRLKFAPAAVVNMTVVHLTGKAGFLWLVDLGFKVPSKAVVIQ